jgi:hypothetical protein
MSPSLCEIWEFRIPLETPMRLVAAAILFILIVVPVGVWKLAASPSHPEPSTTIYDSNPSHPWNRLYAALLVREDRNGNRYGEDSLDPLLWGTTEHLLSEPSHQQAMAVLDEFLRTRGESLVHDPVKRAMLQRDLWGVFDWSVMRDSVNNQYDKERRELQVRLAEVLRRLALTPDEIKSLPDNYAQAVASGSLAKEFDPADPQRPFLPPDLFDPNGSWAGITPSPDYDGLGVAKTHIFNFSGRSSFLVFVKLPGGHKATMDYFQALWNFSQPWVQEMNSDQAAVNPALPSFPAGTEVALVRRVNLFDNQGNLVTSNITESVQVRVYHAITTIPERFFSRSLADTIKNSGQYFYEIKLSRPLLFSAKNGGLRAVGRDEKELSTFQTKGVDPIESIGPAGKPDSEIEAVPELQHCVWCHSGGGVHSFNSREALLRPNRMQMEPGTSDYGSIYGGDNSAIDWKQNHYDWGLLNGYWKAGGRPQ